MPHYSATLALKFVTHAQKNVKSMLIMEWSTVDAVPKHVVDVLRNAGLWPVSMLKNEKAPVSGGGIFFNPKFTFIL